MSNPDGWIDPVQAEERARDRDARSRQLADEDAADAGWFARLIERNNFRETWQRETIRAAEAWARKRAG